MKVCNLQLIGQRETCHLGVLQLFLIVVENSLASVAFLNIGRDFVPFYIHCVDDWFRSTEVPVQIYGIIPETAGLGIPRLTNQTWGALLRWVSGANELL